MSVRTELEETI